MTLIKSISGIRGTIGGKPGESLSPIDIVKFSAAEKRRAFEKYVNAIKHGWKPSHKNDRK